MVFSLTPRQCKRHSSPFFYRREWGLVAWAGQFVPQIAVFSLFSMLWIGPAAAEETSLTDLRQQTRTLLRNEAVAPEGYKKDAATAALCDMYVILRHDQRYSESEMLRSDAAKVRRRLITIARRLEGQLKRQKIARPSSLTAEVDAAIEAALTDGGEKLGSFAKPTAAGGAPFADEGWRLVELIERIVAPDFWESRGGPGAIRYFAIRRVLVVRATTDVHEQIKDLLRALR